MTEEDLHAEASRILKALLARRQVKHADLAEALSKAGLDESVSSIKGKLHRGTFSFAWMLACCKALGLRKITLDDDSV